MLHRLCVVAGLLAMSSLSPPAVSGAKIKAGGSRLIVPVRSMQELRFEKLVRQGWDMSCGAAALSTLFTYHLDLPVSEYAVATWILRGVDPQRVRARGGFSLLDLKRFSEALGYEAEGYGRMSLEELVAMRAPAIVPVRIHGLDHFVIMRGIVGGRVVLGDPAFGNMMVTASQFQQIWKGGIAFFVSGQEGDASSAEPLTPDIAALSVPDLPGVARRLRGMGPVPLTRGQPSLP